jgi:glutaconate CoA-transferase, subunit A
MMADDRELWSIHIPATLGAGAVMPRLAHSLDEAVAPIGDGCTLLIPRESAGVAMAATRVLIRRGVKRLDVIAVPTSSLQADLLVGAGCVATLEAAGVSLGEFGPAPRVTAALLQGTLGMRDTTCPAVYAGLQAGEKGVPFMPLRGLIGSDVLNNRPDWRVINNPFGTDDPIVLLPALRADIAIFHAPLADRLGNVWIGRERELMLMAHAAQQSIVTVEEIIEGNLLEDPLRAPATLAGLYISVVAKAPRGAWPLGLPGCYRADPVHLAKYVHLAQTQPGFTSYLERYVHEQRAA